VPSPVAHSLAGLALVRLSPYLGLGRDRSSLPQPGARASARREYLWYLGALIFASNAPDLDFIPGILVGDPGRFHHGPIHSLGVAVLFGSVTALLAHRAGVRSAFRFGLLMGLAFSIHLVLDMLSTDNSVRHGVSLFWPFLDQSLSLPYPIFIDIKRDTQATSFIQSLLMWHNVYAVLRELLVVGVVLPAPAHRCNRPADP
jgi:inner membrane protein